MVTVQLQTNALVTWVTHFQTVPAYAFLLALEVVLMENVLHQIHVRAIMALSRIKSHKISVFHFVKMAVQMLNALLQTHVRAMLALQNSVRIQIFVFQLV